MDERVRLAELVELSRGVSTIELRDALRREGRSSITSADIERMLASSVSQRSGPSAVATATATPSTVPTAPTLPTPYPWQQSALDAWHHAGDRGVIEAVTGAGKTMIGLLAAGEEIARRGQVAVIVPTRELLAQWVALLRPILPPGVTLGLLGDGSRQGLDCHDVVVAVVNSARDLNVYPRRPGGLLIADECHRYGSACNSLVLHDRFPRRLGLSATFARSDDAHETLLKPYLGGVCFRLGYTEARIAGVIAAFDVTLIEVEFTPSERAMYVEATQRMAAALGALAGRGLVFRDVNESLLAVLSVLARRDDDAGGMARSYLQAMQERRRLMDEASAKLAVLGEIAAAVGHADRTIVFTQSIAAAEAAAATLRRFNCRAEAMHSELLPGERKALMQRFRDGQIEALAAPQILDEGVDVPEADLAVVLGASRSRRQMVQRMGRVLRRKADSRRARFVIVSVRETTEDPRQGAHESFLDEVLPVARRVRSRRFGEHDLAADLLP